MRRAVPWFLAFIFATIALVLWLSRPSCESEDGVSDQCKTLEAAVQEGDESARAKQPVLRPQRPQHQPQPESDGNRRQAIARQTERARTSPCEERLKEAQSLLEQCRRASQPAQARFLPSLRDCLLLPAVREFAESSQKCAEIPAEVPECGLGERVRIERETSVRELMQDHLGLTSEETDYLAETACALKELRWWAVQGFRADDPTSLEVGEGIRSERQEILRQLEEQMGVENYERFRKLGGLGLLNDALQCEDDSIR
jgi:hypothetical protein